MIPLFGIHSRYTTREELVTVIKHSASGSVLEQIP